MEKKTETVLGVKKRVERETGEKVEMLRRGLFRFVSVSSFSLSLERAIDLAFFFFFFFLNLFDARAFFICFI